MNHAKMFVAILGMATLSVPASAQQDYSDVQIKTTKVAGNVYMLEGRGGNIGVSVGEDGILMVDDQYAPLSDKIRAALRELGNDKPRFILNTMNTAYWLYRVHFGRLVPQTSSQATHAMASLRSTHRRWIYETPRLKTMGAMGSTSPKTRR